MQAAPVVVVRDYDCRTADNVVGVKSARAYPPFCMPSDA